MEKERQDARLDPMFLQRGLELGSSAIGYHFGRELKEWARPRVVLELAGGENDIWAFAREGLCEVSLRDDIHNQVGVAWSQRGCLSQQQRTAWARVRWQGQALEAVTVAWDRGFSGSEACTWIIADKMEAAMAFATALSDFSALSPGALLVFSNGCWSHDRQTFQAIQQSCREDLILPPGFLERILDDALHFLSSRATYEKYGLPYKRGLLLAGPPGNGKTACLRLLLRQVGLPSFFVRSFVSMFGQVEQNVASVFWKAKSAAPCVLVLEDLDVLVQGNGMSALLNALDGLGADTGILTLATSNHPEKLDPALVDRPSRFDRVYRFELPGPEERRRYLERWNERLEPELRIDSGAVDELAGRSEGFSFAFLQELVVSAMVRWVSEKGARDMAGLLRTELDALIAQRAATAASSVQREEKEPELSAMQRLLGLS